MTANVFPDFLELIGKPYEPGARGPDSFDCWGLVTHVFKDAWGIDLPLFAGLDSVSNMRESVETIENGLNGPDWEELPAPVHGCLLAMSRSKVIHHVGVWLEIDGGLCLHALDGCEVVAQNLSRLRQDRFSKILFFKYNG